MDFALANPGLFRLMFASDNPDPDDAAARAAGDESFAVLLDAVADVHGRDPRDNPELMVDVAAAWSVVHGLANLLLAGRLSFIAELPEAQYEAALVRMIEGALRKR